MKRDIKYIIKRILIGVGIALLLGFIKDNVYASEYNDLLAGNNTELIDYRYFGDVYVNDIYVNWYQSQYVVPVYNTSTHTATTPSTSTSNGCYGLTRKNNYYASIGSNDPYNMPVYPSTPVLGANWGGCSLSNTKYMTLGGIILDITNPNYIFEEGKYYKINMYYINEYSNSSRDSIVNNTINDPEDLKVIVPNTMEVYSMQYMTIDYEQGPFTQVQNTTSSFYNWLLISIVLKTNQDTTNPVIYFGYNPSSTLISGTSNYPESFTSSFNSPLLMYNRNKGNSSWANAMNLNGVRPFIYEYTVENPSIQIPDFSSMVEDQLSDINDDITSGIENGTYTPSNELDAFTGGGGGTGFAFGTNNISDILIVPLRFLQKFNSDTTCEPLQIPLPMINDFEFPCISTFFVDFFGSDLYSMIQLILSCYVGLKICLAFYRLVLNILDPQTYVIN